MVGMLVLMVTLGSLAGCGGGGGSTTTPTGTTPDTYTFTVTGTGSLTISAQLIDVGNLSLQSIGQLNLNADNGDIRGDGTLDIALCPQ